MVLDCTIFPAWMKYVISMMSIGYRAVRCGAAIWTIIRKIYVEGIRRLENLKSLGLQPLKWAPGRGYPYIVKNIGLKKGNI